MEKLVLSQLAHTWVLDLDGTVLKHNGYKLDGEDSLLDGALEFLRQIPQEDMIVFLTSRDKRSMKARTEDFLNNNNIRYSQIIYDAPFGERILINDRKPSGLTTALAVNLNRDENVNILIETSASL